MVASRSSGLGLAVLVLLAGMAASAHAQKLYRCGNTYQDRPCAGEQPGKVIGSSGTPQTASAGASADPYCARRGEKAQKIMWAKEAGRTEEMQLSATTHPEDRKLIGEVYRKRGSSVEVRAAIEADCMDERQRAAQAAALIDAAAKLQGQNAAASPATPPAAREADPAATEQQQRETAARESAARKARCDRISQRLESIRKSQRTGGTGATMDRLSQQKQDTEREWSAAGCQS
ncbi:MAG: hypothetical protein BroJett006_07060 [Betaproteobacteria bacterium]|nr:MAG: hypothetical protein BroJett006_07060 [Betaproteobacteria bacterium]